MGIFKDLVIYANYKKIKTVLGRGSFFENYFLVIKQIKEKSEEKSNRRGCYNEILKLYEKKKVLTDQPID